MCPHNSGGGIVSATASAWPGSRSLSSTRPSVPLSSVQGSQPFGLGKHIPLGSSLRPLSFVCVCVCYQDGEPIIIG